MSYSRDVKEFNDLRNGNPMISIQTHPNFDAPGYELTGGTNFNGTLEESIREIKARYRLVYTAGFECRADHVWELVSYEVFSQTYLRTPNNDLIDEKIYGNVIFCYYRPINPTAIMNLIALNHQITV